MIVWSGYDAKLEPGFKADVDALLTADRSVWVVTYGRRTRDEQALLYANWLKWLDENPKADPKTGPRAAPPGLSAHECGLAVDFALLLGTKRNWAYASNDWRRIVAAIRAHPRLHSLDGIGDTDHAERVHWQEFKDWDVAR